MATVGTYEIQELPEARARCLQLVSDVDSRHVHVGAVVSRVIAVSGGSFIHTHHRIFAVSRDSGHSTTTVATPSPFHLTPCEEKELQQISLFFYHPFVLASSKLLYYIAYI